MATEQLACISSKTLFPVPHLFLSSTSALSLCVRSSLLKELLGFELVDTQREQVPTNGSLFHAHMRLPWNIHFEFMIRTLKFEVLVCGP